VGSLLVTNDFPPKVGGIQSYLSELWHRLPPSDVTVLTTAYPGAAAWDAERSFRVVRTRERQMLPTRSLARRIRALATEVGADLVFLDPWLPLGHLGPTLEVPYVVILHGAEVTVPGRLPLTRRLGARVLRHAAGVVAAGHYPVREALRVARRPLRGLVVAPGVDIERFRPLDASARADVRRAFGLDPDRPLVLGLSRLVPRKGFDVLVDAVAAQPSHVQLAIGGAGRDRRRLEARAARREISDRVRLLGRVPDAALAPLYASADMFVMPCRDRWGGLEAEGFGIVFLEAAAAGVPVIAGRSGGSHEAVVDGETGLVVDGRDARAVAGALRTLLLDDARRERMGAAARRRAVTEHAYDQVVAPLAPLAAGDLSCLRPLDAA
jgi:phosphatidylinositol alpha-1,6-mannosyltransferase